MPLTERAGALEGGLIAGALDGAQRAVDLFDGSWIVVGTQEPQAARAHFIDELDDLRVELGRALRIDEAHPGIVRECPSARLAQADLLHHGGDDGDDQDVG